MPALAAPVSRFVAVTVTPGSTALVSSVTVPTRLASCAKQRTPCREGDREHTWQQSHARAHRLSARVRCPRAVEEQHRFERIAVRRGLQEMFRDRDTRAISAARELWRDCDDRAESLRWDGDDQIDKFGVTRFSGNIDVAFADLAVRDRMSIGRDPFTLLYDARVMDDNAVCMSGCKMRSGGRR